MYFYLFRAISVFIIYCSLRNTNYTNVRIKYCLLFKKVFSFEFLVFSLSSMPTVHWFYNLFLYISIYFWIFGLLFTAYCLPCFFTLYFILYTLYLILNTFVHCSKKFKKFIVLYEIRIIRMYEFTMYFYIFLCISVFLLFYPVG